MNLRRLDCFLAVARELHFRRAAERLHMAQPALSAQIAKLEHELDVALFERSRRKVTLTPAGDALLARARLLVPTLRDALAEATSIGEGRAGKLTVGFVGSAAYQLLPRVLRLAEKELPAVQIVLREATSDVQAEALAVGELDLAVTRVPSPLPALTSTKIVTEPFVVALPARHPLARDKVVAAKLLDDLPLVTLPPGGGVLREAMLAELADAGASPRIVDEVFEMPTILGLVAAGRGVALVPTAVSELHLGGVVFRRLRSPKRHAELWALKRRDDQRPVIRTLVQLLARFSNVAGRPSAMKATSLSQAPDQPVASSWRRRTSS